MGRKSRKVERHKTSSRPLSLSEKLHKRRLKRKSGPSGLRRAALRVSLRQIHLDKQNSLDLSTVSNTGDDLSSSSADDLSKESGSGGSRAAVHEDTLAGLRQEDEREL